MCLLCRPSLPGSNHSAQFALHISIVEDLRNFRGLAHRTLRPTRLFPKTVTAAIIHADPKPSARALLIVWFGAAFVFFEQLHFTDYGHPRTSWRAFYRVQTCCRDVRCGKQWTVWGVKLLMKNKLRAAQRHSVRVLSSSRLILSSNT